MMLHVLLQLALAVGTPPAGVEGARVPPGTGLPAVDASSPTHLPGLPNMVSFGNGLLSGGVPTGREAFERMRGLGIRTVVSVDGAVPDLESARAAGLRYIHLPIGYDGIDESRRHELARAVRDGLGRGRVYLHCHHGKHRSAAASGVVGVGLGWITPDQALQRMSVAGTSPRYRGLLESVSEATRLDPRRIEAVPADLPEVSRPSDLVEAMVELDRVLEHLERISDASWRTPHAHPDLVPAAEAGRLADLFRLAIPSKGVMDDAGLDLVRRLEVDADRASRLEAGLLEAEIPVDEMDGLLGLIRSSCRECHDVHRNRSSVSRSG